VAILLRLAGTIVSVRQLGFWLLAATFVFSQLPFSIGQKRLQRNALWKYPAVKSVEFGKTLSEVAPLFPPFQLLSSLATTGTGSLLYYVLDETIKNGLKSLVG
jgi:hypothetical protein